MAPKAALYQRNPSMTPEEFSLAWHRHGQLVLPYILSLGYKFYAQLHPPLSLSSADISASELQAYDAGAQSTRADSPPEEAAWQKAYYQEVLLPDEKCIFVSEAVAHMKIVEGVTGTTVEVIREGQGMIDVPDSIMAVWRAYEARGTRPKE